MRRGSDSSLSSHHSSSATSSSGATRRHSQSSSQPQPRDAHHHHPSSSPGHHHHPNYPATSTTSTPARSSTSSPSIIAEETVFRGSSVDLEGDSLSVVSSADGGGSAEGGAGERGSTTTASTASAGDKRIQVCVRVRPLLPTESYPPPSHGSSSRLLDLSSSGVLSSSTTSTNNKDNSSSSSNDMVAWTWHDSRGVITQTVFPAWEAKSLYRQANGRAQVTYAFDQLFTPTHTTRDIYEQVLMELVRSSLEGINASVFAYGQTATGKTYTLQGNASSPGVIPLAVHDVFARIAVASSDRTFSARVSYLEIYNEQIHDLLCPSTPTSRIQILDDPKMRGVTIKGIREETVTSPTQALALIAAGDASRHIGATDLNAHSSRSHTIFRMTIESTSRAGDGGGGGGGVHRAAVLSLVDLAGSENAKLTNATGGRQKEGQYINKSLLALGHVIQKLSSSSSSSSSSSLADTAGHVPFRDSKLTRLLQPSLEGKGLVAIICAISPSVSCLDESHNTLKFASRAKRIRVRADVNEIMDDASLVIKYRDEISALKEELAKAKAAAAISPALLRRGNGGGGLYVLSEQQASSLLHVANQLANITSSSSSSSVTLGGGGGGGDEDDDDENDGEEGGGRGGRRRRRQQGLGGSNGGEEEGGVLLSSVYQHYLATLTAIGIATTTTSSSSKAYGGGDSGSSSSSSLGGGGQQVPPSSPGLALGASITSTTTPSSTLTTEVQLVTPTSYSSSSSTSSSSTTTAGLGRSGVGSGRGVGPLGSSGGLLLLDGSLNSSKTTLQSQIRDLRSKLEQKEVTANLITADRHFLQQLLLEREELLGELAQVVEEVDDKQRMLETEMLSLRQENDTLIRQLLYYHEEQQRQLAAALTPPPPTDSLAFQDDEDEEEDDGDDGDGDGGDDYDGGGSGSGDGSGFRRRRRSASSAAGGGGGGASLYDIVEEGEGEGGEEPSPCPVKGPLSDDDDDDDDEEGGGGGGDYRVALHTAAASSSPFTSPR